MEYGRGNGKHLSVHSKAYRGCMTFDAQSTSNLAQKYFFLETTRKTTKNMLHAKWLFEQKLMHDWQ